MVGVESFDLLGLSDETCELAVERDEVGGFDELEDEVKVLVKVLAVHLHLLLLYNYNNL